MDEAVAASVASPRFRMVLLALFAITATLIATCGIYGLMAYAVTLRRIATHSAGLPTFFVSSSHARSASSLPA